MTTAEEISLFEAITKDEIKDKDFITLKEKIVFSATCAHRRTHGHTTCIRDGYAPLDCFIGYPHGCSCYKTRIADEEAEK